jgi:TorA-specific chaperone
MQRELANKGTDSDDEIQRINLVRGSVYAFLSRTFKKEIDEEFLSEIIRAAPTVRLLAESQDRHDLIEASKRLGLFIQEVEASSNAWKRDLRLKLRVEFTNLFIAVGDDSVQLIESAYLNQESSRYDKPAEDVHVAYQSLGFKKNAEFCESDDHLALEFEFMASLCNWTAQTLRDNDVENAIAYLSLQKEFLRDHILRWVPELCRTLKSKAKSDFYRSIADLTAGFVDMDSAMPDHLTATLRANLERGVVQ